MGNVQGKIIRGYWDCGLCDTKEIDGLADYCPNCGTHKPADVKYHLKGMSANTQNQRFSQSIATKEDELDRLDLKKAGINKEDCDGKHADWICPFCETLNNYRDEVCHSCGAPKDQSTRSYTSVEEDRAAKVEEYRRELEEQVKARNQERRAKRKKLRPKRFLFIAVLIAILFVTFFPFSRSVTVTGKSWLRNIDIEMNKQVRESDWSVPAGGEVYDQKQEIRSYNSVVDHYEDVEVTKSRREITGYETKYNYVDNGNGTFTEQEEQVPIYETVYYTEKESRPVYVQVPVYGTKYYYTIMKWVDTDKHYKTKGNETTEPYWSADYSLADNERDTSRTEQYTIHYDKGNNREVSYREWQETKIGDKTIVMRSLLGITY